MEKKKTFWKSMKLAILNFLQLPEEDWEDYSIFKLELILQAGKYKNSQGEEIPLTKADRLAIVRILNKRG